MSDIIRCPSCRCQLQVPPALLRQDVQCPTCGATFATALADDVPPPPPSEATHRLRLNDALLPAQRAAEPHPSATEDRRSQREWERLGYRRRDQLPHRAGLIVLLGLLGLVPVLGVFPGPVAWIVGEQDLREMVAGRMDPEGESSTRYGRWCGLIGTLMNGTLLALALLVILFGER